MGRKRAAFPEGITEEEQRYAQVLRDIRDLRGETQQELGRLLDWSVSTVSRFEAAAERPDEATHRRYCALAPTEELRERQRRPTRPCHHGQNGMPHRSGRRPRSGTAAPWTVLGSTDLLPDQRWVQLISLDRHGLEMEPRWRDALSARNIVAPGAAAIDLGLRVARAVTS